MRKLSFRPIAFIAAMALLFFACGDDTTAPGPHVPPDPARAISDAAHGDIEDQNPGFWWLPPMVDQTTQSGSFQSAFSPTVKVILCRKSLDATVTCDPGTSGVESPDTPGLLAEFGVGTGLTVEADHFKVEFDTDAFGLEPTAAGDTTVYRIFAFTDALPDFGGPFVMGYADFQLAETGNEVKKLSGEDTTTIALVDGRTLPIKFFVNEAAYPHELVTNPEATEAVGIGTLCEINCSITVVSTEDTTEASLVDDAGVERTAILFEPGDVGTTSVLVIDERTEEGEGANCAVGVNLEKKNCFRYEITPSVPFNNPVRMGICPVDVPKGQGVWRILQVDEGVVNRPPEVDVSDFLQCTGSTAFLDRVLDWIIRPLYAEDFDGTQLQGTSDLFWSLDAESSAEPGVATAEAGSTLSMTVTIVGTHPEPDVPLEGEPVDFLITLGAGSLAAPAGITPESTTLADDGTTVIGMRLLTDANGEATVDWTVGAGDNTLEASTPEAEGGPITFDVFGAPDSGWTTAGGLVDARREHLAWLVTDSGPHVEKVVVVAGTANSTEVYDPTTGISTVLNSGTVYAHGQGATATRLVDGRILIVGGFGAPAMAEVYVPPSGSFTAIDSLDDGRWAHTATLLGDGRVLIAGGRSSAAFFPTLASAEIFDPATNTFAPVTSTMGTGRWLHAAGLLPDGSVLLAGGVDGGSSAELFDAANGGTFSSTGSMSRFGYTGYTGAHPLPDGRVVMVTGGLSLTTAEVYEPVSGTFTVADSTEIPRNAARATQLADGRVLVSGGVNTVSGSYEWLASAELFDPALGGFVSVASMSQERADHASVLLGDGRVLVLGGRAPGSDIASAEIFSPPAK